MTTETITPAEAPPATGTVRIDFLFLDLTTCTRCRGTDRSLGAALTEVAEMLAAAGVEVEVNNVHVVSEELARAWRFVSSPTIRVNGADIALELRESSCGSEACTDGCGDQIACRVWVYRGQEYTEPPVAMIVDAILRHVYGTAVEPVQTPRYQLPANLRRFFAGRSEPAQTPHPGRGRTEPAPTGATETSETGCCPVSEQQTCCDASAKADCCGSAPEQGCGRR